ncbi:uncharacterized protein LOC127838235 [Dreissena polymorpha]|uniref:uncharacterized protein LOC127838235 n=1 Tax=Dreissena polymorpha TaxID=45954 RepID=UPI0022644064|nr:uncharacterized protein LOC127838235 [Dreissena polymorpha]
MIFVVIGIVRHIIADFRQHISSNKDVNATTTSRPSNISPEFRFSTTTVYIGYMVGLFVVTGLLHFKECIYLLHGLLYLLFVPSGYLILVLYSICNITDITWGTREERQKSNISSKLAWRIQCEQLFRYLFIRFFKGQSNYRIQAYDPFDAVMNNAGVFDEDFARSNMYILPGSISGTGNVDDELRLANVRTQLTPSKLRELQEVNRDEYYFWDTLKERCLSPQSTSDRQNDGMKGRIPQLFRSPSKLYTSDKRTVSFCQKHGLNLFGEYRNERKKQDRRWKRRSNVCLNKPKNKKRSLFPLGAEYDTSASPGDRQPACTSSTYVTETPTDQCRPAFHDNIVNAPHKRKTKKARSS